jgi:hypothetical protein
MVRIVEVKNICTGGGKVVSYLVCRFQKLVMLEE